MKKILVLSTALLLLAFIHASAHEGHKNKKQDSTTTHVDSLVNKDQREHIQGDTIHHHDDAMKPDESKIGASLSDFPTLHPIIVHSAIVLIIVAALLQLINVYWMKREIRWIVTGILLVGVVAAWLASKNFHPHTHGISEHAKLVLSEHDKWADLTIYFGFAASLFQIANHFVFKDKRWASTLVAILLVISAYCVAHAGHYGAQLVHIEGIGPQGKFLEMEHHH